MQQAPPMRGLEMQLHNSSRTAKALCLSSSFRPLASMAFVARAVGVYLYKSFDDAKISNKVETCKFFCKMFDN